MISAYFAHPAFTPEQLKFKEKLVEILIESPIKLLDPFDYSPAIEGDRELKKQISKVVVDANERLIERSDLVIAVIDDRDQGVIWEMGYAYARGIPTITISQFDYDVNLMLSGTVIGHIPNVLDNKENLKSILRTFNRVRTDE